MHSRETRFAVPLPASIRRSRNQAAAKRPCLADFEIFDRYCAALGVVPGNRPSNYGISATIPAPRRALQTPSCHVTHYAGYVSQAGDAA